MVYSVLVIKLEAIPELRRDCNVWMKLATLYWCLNDYE